MGTEPSLGSFADGLRPVDPAAGRWLSQALPPAHWTVRLIGLVWHAVDAGDVLVAVGLLLLARGCYLLHPAAGWIAPGAILIWWALPSRPPFVKRVSPATPLSQSLPPTRIPNGPA